MHKRPVPSEGRVKGRPPPCRPGRPGRVRSSGADMVAAVSITCADGCVIVDEGPDHKFSDATDQAEAPKPSRAQTAQTAGTVRLSLYAPKGELRGVLRDDGTVLRIGPKEA